MSVPSDMQGLRGRHTIPAANATSLVCQGLLDDHGTCGGSPAESAASRISLAKMNLLNRDQ